MLPIQTHIPLGEVQNEIEVFELIDFSISLNGELHFSTQTLYGDIEYFTILPTNPQYFEILKELQEEFCKLQKCS